MATRRANPQAVLPAQTPLENSTLRGQTIVLTGRFTSRSRKDAEELLKGLGATPSGSVSKKTSLLIAGAAAGSKLADAYQLGIPILGEGHLRLLLAGHPLEEVIALARTIYVLRHTGPEDQPAPDGAASLSQRGGLPRGVGGARWPSHGGQPMQHLFSLDLRDMPALQVHYPEARALSVFCSVAEPVDMYRLRSPKNSLLALRFSTQAQVDEAAAPPPGVESRPARRIIPAAHPWSERASIWTRSRVLGALPSWCQAPDPQGNFIMQFGEELGVSGDGLVYVFDDSIFAQFT